jgi:hypothetical protein
MGVRLRIAGGAVRPRFVPGAEDGDETIVADGIRVFVAKTILDANGGAVEIDATEEHDSLTVRPLGSHA